MPCLRAYAPRGIRTRDPLITSREQEPLHHSAPTTYKVQATTKKRPHFQVGLGCCSLTDKQNNMPKMQTKQVLTSKLLPFQHFLGFIKHSRGCAPAEKIPGVLAAPPAPSATSPVAGCPVVRAMQDSFREMEWVVATPWQPRHRGNYGVYVAMTLSLWHGTAKLSCVPHNSHA